jgi:hypothetical protein|tara:strand:+ start:6335 stop:6742 length:408 start_codon:yes stop_codon:yes gene_type:complete
MALQKKIDEFQFVEEVGNNRITSVKERLQSMGDAEDRMLLIMEILVDTQPIPDVGDYYTFIYNAKTPGIEYDQHPLIACLEIYKWGFKGLNYHWGQVRNYTWEEVPGFLHVVRNSELQDLRDIGYAYFISKPINK